MRNAVLTLAIGVGALGATGGLVAQNRLWPAPSTEARAVFTRFAGIYKLVQVDPAASASPARGYLAYDASGYMSVAIEWPNRPRVSGQLTGEQARTALDGFTAYFGSFVVNEPTGTITHQTLGALQPQISGTDLRERFTLMGSRLALRAPASPGGADRTLTWERQPDLPSLTPLQRQLVGFWRLVSTERRNSKGDLVRSYPGWTGFIVYAASGQMLVHMAEPYRRRPVGDVPTPDEAMAAYQNYTSYFGTYTIQPSGRSLVHHVEGSVNPGAAGTDTERFFEFSGKQLLLRPPTINTPDGDVTMTNVWERVQD